MQFQVGDILSVPLFAHTRHFFVYIEDDGKVVEWGPWDGMSWMGGRGNIFRVELFKVQNYYKWLGRDGELKEITLVKRTGASRRSIEERIKHITPGIDYHLGHRNCEHFSYYVTGETGRSKQSISHLFTDHDPFTSRPMIHTYSKLRDELLRCKFCGPVRLNRKEFDSATLVGKLDDGYYAYHFSHPLGGQHIYISSLPKDKNFEDSYNSVVLAYYGAFAGRGEILAIIRKLRGC
ncbi:MAG: hypothetical protein ACP5D7_02075 [Limnospira sp.]